MKPDMTLQEVIAWDKAMTRAFKGIYSRRTRIQYLRRAGL